MQLIDWDFALSIVPALLRAAVITVEVTVAGFALAVALGLILALLRRGRSRVVRSVVIAIVEFIRSTPLLVQVFFIFFLGPRIGVRLGPFQAGILALGLHYGCLLSEVYRAGLNAIPRGQWEAPIALNLGWLRAYRAIILPQAIPPMVPLLTNAMVSMFKDTPLLSSIGVIELMARAKLIGNDTFRYLEPITLVGVFFLIMSLAAAAASNWLEHWLNRRLRPAGFGR
jgi:polar amino acid transport system permease protein